ncbi:MAG: hypothetical protein JWP83_5620 [Mycobacterium sp.]|jgi:hypothetical protein|nr:hypothetical protein [Mycobacterium sp.]MCW2664468.1 hypothetical protein [Mycobacterium sp.]
MPIEFTEVTAEIADVTLRWLTAALAANGIDVDVDAIATEPIGTGQMGY